MNRRILLCAVLTVTAVGLLIWAATEQPSPTPAASLAGNSSPVTSTPTAGLAGDPAAADRKRVGDPPAGEGRGFEPFPEDWFFPDRRTGRRYAQPKTLEGKPAPRLKVKDWIGDPPDLNNLEGKVVVVDFWATWCGPCVRSIPENIKLVDEYKEKDLLFIGVHDSKRGFDRAPVMVEKVKINYPVGVDDGGASARAWRVSFWPTYIVLDRKGIVRAAGLKPRYIKSVVKTLLAEEVDDEDDEDEHDNDDDGKEGDEDDNRDG
jgi:thiol-disulfide isomerase/thioredoxin